jgi:hypothetical protein
LGTKEEELRVLRTNHESSSRQVIRADAEAAAWREQLADANRRHADSQRKLEVSDEPEMSLCE